MTHLWLKDRNVDDPCLKKLMDAISEQPSLRTLSFEEIYDENGCFLFDRDGPINALAGILSNNEQVDEIKAENSSCLES
jgi:hypothetical protein